MASAVAALEQLVRADATTTCRVVRRSSIVRSCARDRRTKVSEGQRALLVELPPRSRCCCCCCCCRCCCCCCCCCCRFRCCCCSRPSCLRSPLLHHASLPGGRGGISCKRRSWRRRGSQ